MREAPSLSGAELSVMQKIWEIGREVTAGELVQALSGERGWKIQTVNTFLTRLMAKGMLTCHKQGTQNHYAIAVTQEQYRAFKTRAFLKEVHGGSMKSFFAALNDQGMVSAQELEELKTWLSQR